MRDRREYQIIMKKKNIILCAAAGVVVVAAAAGVTAMKGSSGGDKQGMGGGPEADRAEWRDGTADPDDRGPRRGAGVGKHLPDNGAHRDCGAG